MLLKGEIPSLINGVSQQPPAMRQPTQCEEQINCYSSAVDGLRRRPGTTYVTSIPGVDYPDDCFVHFYERTDSEKYIFIISNKPGAPMKVYDLTGKEYPVYNAENVPYLIAWKPKDEFKALSIADTTFLLNTKVTVDLEASTAPGIPQEALIYLVTAGVKGMSSRVYINGTLAAEVICGDTEPEQRTTWIVEQLTEKLRTTLPSIDWSIQSRGNVIYLYQKNYVSFDITVADSRGNTVIKCLKDKIKNFNDLPKMASNDMRVEVVGSGGTKYDNYYVKFQQTSPIIHPSVAPTEGFWVECAAWGARQRLDPKKMPVRITREQGSGGVVFRVHTIQWDYRAVGDAITAPPPSFVGCTLNDIFFYRNRLGFLSDENAIYSEVGEYFNFFPTTVTTTVASDPIDNAAAHRRISELKHAISFQDTLIFTTEQTQFYQDSGEVFSGETAAIKTLTEYDVDTKVAPVSSGKAIFLPFQRGAYFGIREYFVDIKGGTYGATDVTSHIPHYLEGRIRAMDVCMNEDTLVCLSDKYKDRIYVYKWFWNGEDKLQSSWSYWTLPTEQILSAKFIGNKLYCVCLRPGWEYLDVYMLALEPGYVDKNPDTQEALAYEYALDCKMFLPVDNTKAPSHWGCGPRKKVNGLIMVGLPSLSTDSFTTSNLAIYALNSTHSPITQYSIYPDGNMRYLAFPEEGNEELYTKPLVVGKTFKSQYKLSPIFLRKQTTNGAYISISEGRLQLRKLGIVFGPSGPFVVKVSPAMRDTHLYVTHEYVAQNVLLGEEASIIGSDAIRGGRFTVPILSRNTNVDITIESDGILPFALLSMEWVGFYTTVAKEL